MARRRIRTVVLSLLLAIAAPWPALAQSVSIERPGEREFIVDLAEMIDPAAEEKVREACNKLLSETMAPLIVVTIGSMAEHGGGGLRIETFGMLLFNQWGIGHESIRGTPLNHGILLLVSAGDRKARIELGAGWGRDHDHLAKRIMDEQIVPRFKEGDYSGGIVAGVQALDKMARGFKIPGPRRPWWHYALIVGVVALGIWSFVSLLEEGGERLGVDPLGGRLRYTRIPSLPDDVEQTRRPGRRVLRRLVWRRVLGWRRRDGLVVAWGS